MTQNTVTSSLKVIYFHETKHSFLQVFNSLYWLNSLILRTRILKTLNLVLCFKHQFEVFLNADFHELDRPWFYIIHLRNNLPSVSFLIYGKLVTAQGVAVK